MKSLILIFSFSQADLISFIFFLGFFLYLLIKWVREEKGNFLIKIIASIATPLIVGATLFLLGALGFLACSWILSILGIKGWIVAKTIWFLQLIK
ncbi:MAG TPA: hypothetical protein P5232_02535 [Candidatus Moranbacteria bacterium]|nr:hypothetical protein [Candidatus Moranbacteria bacterium]